MKLRLSRRNLGYNPPSNDVSKIYLEVSGRSLESIRLRSRSSEGLDPDELSDYLHALEALHDMLKCYGGSYVEEYVDAELARYDARWMDAPRGDSRLSLIDLLWEARDEFARKNSGGEQDAGDQAPAAVE